ncbi:hypothetical protein HY628_02710 [Candidatus Uhrbacteria bacterium]|nr:hypothetical protein [Candidatus Uhrbacteria bacterium]
METGIGRFGGMRPSGTIEFHPTDQKTGHRQYHFETRSDIEGLPGHYVYAAIASYPTTGDGSGPQSETHEVLLRFVKTGNDPVKGPWKQYRYSTGTTGSQVSLDTQYSTESGDNSGSCYYRGDSTHKKVSGMLSGMLGNFKLSQSATFEQRRRWDVAIDLFRESLGIRDGVNLAKMDRPAQRTRKSLPGVVKSSLQRFFDWFR